MSKNALIPSGVLVIVEEISEDTIASFPVGVTTPARAAKDAMLWRGGSVAAGET